MVATGQSDPSDVLFVKGPDWAHEKEWRIVQFFPAKEVHSPRLNQFSKLKGEGFFLTGIIFGLNTPTEFKEKCKEWVLGQHERPKFFQCARQALGLELSIV